MGAPEGNTNAASRTGPAASVQPDSQDDRGYARVQMQIAPEEKRAWVKAAKREGMSLRAWLTAAAEDRMEKLKRGG